MYLIPISKKGEYSILNTNEWLDIKDEFRENRDSIKSFLDLKGKFDNIYELNSKGESPIKVGFRNTTAFQFQSQSIIANGNIIFYNTDDLSYLEGFRKLFPLALGYKSYKMINLEEDIRELKKDIASKESIIDDLEKRYENWVDNLYQFYTEAINLSLTERDLDIKQSNTSQIKLVLTEIIKDVNNNVLYKKGSALKFNKKLKDFEESRKILLRDLQNKKTDLNKISKFEDLKTKYTENVYNEISKRLSPIDWFLEQNGTDICPFCESQSNKALSRLQNLKEVNIENSKSLENQKLSELTFEKEKRELKSKVIEIEKEITLFDKNIYNLLS
jgi:hypothetical protein